MTWTEIGVAFLTATVNEQTPLGDIIEQGLTPFFPESPFLRYITAHLGVPTAIATITLITRQAMRKIENQGLEKIHNQNQPFLGDTPNEAASKSLNRLRARAVLRERSEPNPNSVLKQPFVRPKQSQRKRAFVLRRKKPYRG